LLFSFCSFSLSKSFVSIAGFESIATGAFADVAGRAKQENEWR
jgi:hypothetical protein